MKVTIADGKYTVVHDEVRGFRALRYGEEWRDLTGDNLVAELALEIEELRTAIEADRKLRGEPVAYAVFSDNGNIRIWCADPIQAESLRKEYGDQIRALYAVPQPDEQPFCEECGDGIMAHDPGICGTCYHTKCASSQPTVTATLQDAERIADVRSVDMALAFFAETPVKRQAIEVVQAVMQAVSKELWLNPIDGSQPAPTYSDTPKRLEDMNKSELIDLIEQQQQEIEAIGAGEWQADELK